MFHFKITGKKIQENKILESKYLLTIFQTIPNNSTCEWKTKDQHYCRTKSEKISPNWSSATENVLGAADIPHGAPENKARVTLDPW